MRELLEPKRVFVGDDLVALVSFAKCCEVCRHCISMTPCDDPTTYACARLSNPEPHLEGNSWDWPDTDERWQLEERIDKWWSTHFVKAGMTCPHFEKVDETYVFVAHEAHMQALNSLMSPQTLPESCDSKDSGSKEEVQP